MEKFDEISNFDSELKRILVYGEGVVGRRGLIDILLQLGTSLAHIEYEWEEAESVIWKAIQMGEDEARSFKNDLH